MDSETDMSSDSEDDIFEACTNGETDKVKRQLMEQRGKIELQSKCKSCTPLAMATRYGQTDTVKMLINMKADIEAKSKYGRTPLVWAVIGGNIEIEKH